MINRALIRLKVIQLVYAYYQQEGKDLDTATKSTSSTTSSPYP